MYSDQLKLDINFDTLKNPSWLRLFVCISFIILSLFIVGNATAQVTSSVNTTESIDLKIATLEQNYDSQLIQILSNYFDKKMFFVDVTVQAEMVNETIATSESQIKRERPKNIIMPGLPFLPEESLREKQTEDKIPETIINQNVFRTLQLTKLDVNIYADSSFSAPEIEFMRRIAGLAIKTDPARGDRINITKVSIPDFSREKPTPIVIEEPVEETTVEATPPDLMTQLSEYKLPLIALGVLIVLLILFIFLWKSRNKDNKSSKESRDSFRNDSSFDAPVVQPNNQFSPTALANRSNDSDFDIDELTEQFFKNPQEISLLFEFWIDTDQEQGIKKASEVVASIDRQLIRSLKKEMRPAHYDAIVEALQTLPELSIEKKREVAKNFNALLKPNGSNSQTESKHAKLGLFKFLNHISDEQIISLMKNEDTQTAALVLDYLPDAKAAEILEKFDSDRATHIMIKMATLHSLSYKQHADISAKLFDKAMDLKEAEKEEKLGAENILPILDKIPLKDQQRYIQQLIDTGSPVGKIIKEQFITIDQIPELDEEIIKAAVSQLSTEVLLNALVGLDKEIINKVLAVRPRREQRLIRIELDQAEIDTDLNTDQAKTVLMNAIRNEAKKQTHI